MMFSNLTNKQKQRGLLILAGLFFIFGLYQLQQPVGANHVLSNGFVVAIAFWAFSRRYSQQFLEKNTLTAAITREGDELIIKQSMASKLSRLNIPRISKITIADNYLSCILDGNGQGFDFQLIGKAGEINIQVNSLLTANEQQTIQITLV